MDLLMPAGDAQWAKTYGFTPTSLTDVNGFLAEQVQQGKIVAHWDGELTILCDVERVRPRLAHWEAQGIVLEPRMVMTAKQKFWDALDFFAEGDLDVFVAPNWAIEITPAMRQTLGRMSAALQKPAAPDAPPAPGTFPDFFPDVAHDPYLMNQYGKLLSHTQQIGEAGKAFRLSIDLCPEYSEPYSNLGTLLWQFGKRREAFVLIVEALVKNPYRVATQMNFIDAGYEMEEYGNVLSVLEYLIPQMPDHPELRHHAAICCHKTGRTAQAVTMLDALITQFPDDTDAQSLRQQFAQAPAGH